LSKPTVDILLATFNGEKYLGEQLESLDRQVDVNVRVWVNDDGSTDETLAILQKWQEIGLVTNISITNGIGSTPAFLKLLSEHPNSEYIAFCDQDDIWDFEKLARQISTLSNEMPIAVTSQRLYIDSSGVVIGKSKKIRGSLSIENALIENVVPGNTILINSQAVRLINRFQKPPIKHYDSWIYLLLSYYGKVIYIDTPLLKYRIHEGNLVGLRRYHARRFIDSAENFLTQALYMSKTLEFNLGQDKNPILMDLVSIFEAKSRFRKAYLFLKLPLVRQRRVDLLGMKLVILILVLTRRS
jgi:glycosyltransferase involved in cell wall biosynthesis